MRLRDLLMATTLMSFTLITTLASPLPVLVGRTEFEDDYLKTNTPPRAVLLLPAPPESIAKDKVLESVYYNTLAILSTSNRCSEFFGGPNTSMDIFSRFVGQVRKDYDSSSVAMRMRGPTINGADVRTNARYRLFSKVHINANGPFYKSANSRSERTIFGIGTFPPNTREVRVLILLHELGHLIRGNDGNWLLPDDGGNERLSRENSRKIEDVCGEQIKRVSDGEAIKNLAQQNQAGNELALDNESSTQSPIERAGKN